MTRRRTSSPNPSARVFSYNSPIEPPGTGRPARTASQGASLRDGVFGVRQRDLDQSAAGRLEPRRALAPELFDFRRHAVEAILLRDADLHALDGFSDRGLVVRHRAIDRR